MNWKKLRRVISCVPEEYLRYLEGRYTVKCQTLTTFGIHIYIFILGGFGRGLGQNKYIYHIQLTVALYEFLGGSEGFGRGLGHDIYIYRHSKGC